ncbi:MAG: kynureninase [Acidimicrobiaceae bacterium]
MTARLQSRADAHAADGADELRSFRDHFSLPDGVLYLDGNSLGPPSSDALKALTAIQDEWASSLVTGWDRWVDLPVHVGDLLGDTLLGAAAGQVIVADSTTIDLYKAVAAALALQPGRRVAVIDRGSFPTDRYIVEQLAADVRVAAPDEVEDALGGDVALVVLSAVDYRTAELSDVEGLTRAAHEAGALVLWDLSHAAGAVPLRLDAWDVDFAVGCTYKYINAGPGAPAYLYVRRDLHDRVVSPIPGWFGHADQFAMEVDYRPADGITRFLTGTPNIPGTTAVAAGVQLLGDAGIDRLRSKGIALTELAIERADVFLPPLGFDVASPRDATRRGSHLALRHPRAADVCAALAADHHVITDHRPPDILRLGFAPLYTRFVDVWDAMVAIEAVGRGLLT